MTTTSGPDAGRHTPSAPAPLCAIVGARRRRRAGGGGDRRRHLAARGDGPSTPSAAANAAPGNGAADNAASDEPQPNPDPVKLRSSFVGLPLNTHVTIDVNTPDQCVQNKHSQAFDVKGSPVNRTDVLFEARDGPGHAQPRQQLVDDRHRHERAGDEDSVASTSTTAAVSRNTHRPSTRSTATVATRRP